MLRLVVYSGGMDSFTLLHHVRALTQKGDALKALSFEYGQRHKKELDFAFAETRRLAIPHLFVRLDQVIPRGNSALTSATPVPLGHYADETMKQTVVPGRNTLFLVAALAQAETLLNLNPDQDRAAVYYGAHSGDHAIYPDCRPAYVYAMQEVFMQATDGRVSLVVPFLHGNKKTILEAGVVAGLTLPDYVRSWTCYEGGEKPCGKCGACVERAEAFAALGYQEY